MAEGFRFMPWVYLGWEPFSSAHGLVKCNINTGVHACARRADLSLREVTIARDGKRRLASANDITHQKHAEDFGRFWKSKSWDLPREKMVGFHLLAGTFVAGATRVGGGADEKTRIERLCLSLLMSKVIKSFVPELRSRYMFFEFRDSYVLSWWTLYVHFTQFLFF